MYSYVHACDTHGPSADSILSGCRATCPCQDTCREHMSVAVMTIILTTAVADLLINPGPSISNLLGQGPRRPMSMTGGIDTPFSVTSDCSSSSQPHPLNPTLGEDVLAKLAHIKGIHKRNGSDVTLSPGGGSPSQRVPTRSDSSEEGGGRMRWDSVARARLKMLLKMMCSSTYCGALFSEYGLPANVLHTVAGRWRWEEAKGMVALLRAYTATWHDYSSQVRGGAQSRQGQQGG